MSGDKAPSLRNLLAPAILSGHCAYCDGLLSQLILSLGTEASFFAVSIFV